MPGGGGTLAANDNNNGSGLESGEPGLADNFTDWFYFTTGATVPSFADIEVFGNYGGEDLDADFRLWKQNDNAYVFPRTCVNWAKLTNLGDGDGDDNVDCRIDGTLESSLNSYRRFCLEPNSKYYIQIAGWRNNFALCTPDEWDGTYRVEVRGSTTAKAPDDICGATSIVTNIAGGYNSGNINWNNTCNTIQAGEPRTTGTRMYNTGWWSFTTPATNVPTSITAYVEENGAGANNAAIAVYESSGGCTFGSLTEKAFNWWCNSSGGNVTVSCLKPSTTYYIQAGTAPNGNDGVICALSSESTGNYYIRLTAQNSVNGQDNICSSDNLGTFASYASGTLTLSRSNHSNECATTQANEPGGGDKSTWYSFTTGATVAREFYFEVNATGGDMDAEVYVYEACNPHICSGLVLNAGELSELANYWKIPIPFSENDADGTLTGVIKPNTTYYVRVDGLAAFDVDGIYNLTVRQQGGTFNGNDDFCNAYTAGNATQIAGSTESITNNDILDKGETIFVNTFNNKAASTQEQCALDEPNVDTDDETVWVKFTTSATPGSSITIDAEGNNGTGGLLCTWTSAWIRVYVADGTPALPASCAGWTSSTNWFDGITAAPGDFPNSITVAGAEVGDESYL
jgi:hypothetical protein